MRSRGNHTEEAWRPPLGGRGGSATARTPTRAAALLAEADTYFAHDHRVVRLVMSGRDPWEPFEPGRVLAHPGGRAALAALAGRARAAAWANVPDGRPLFELLRGVSLDAAALGSALGPELTATLRESGALLADGSREGLGFGVMALGADDEHGDAGARDAVLMTPVPRDGGRTDLVYLGTEALWLEMLREVLDLAPARAVDLGCGAGHLSLAIARSAGSMVATDISGRAAAMTSMAFAMNPTLGARAEVLQTDVAAGLVAGAADLIVANPPWVPVRAGDAARVFADGGPTGCELPLRFLADGVARLAPGGVLVMTTLSPTLRDGRRPIADALAVLPPGLEADLLITPMRERHPSFDHRLLSRHPQLAAVDHVGLIVARVDGGAAPVWRARVDAGRPLLEASGWSHA